MARWLSLALLLVACDDPNACEEIGASRCADESTLEICAEGSSGTRWTRGPCPDGTPTCMEHGASEAICVGESVGECDYETFEGGCHDETTLDDCVQLGQNATRQRVRCSPGQRCGEVPEDSLPEEHPPRMLFACYTPRPPHEPPAIVTFVHGDVQIAGEAAPPVPFRVRPGQRLTLAAEARVVLLVKERASRVTGPDEIDPYAFQPARPTPTPQGAGVVDAITGDEPPALSPDEPLLEPTPSAGGIVRLIVGEGVPGAAARMRRFRWRCDDDCGRTVELRQTQPIDRVVWRGNGERELAYDGPPLEANARYQLRLGEHTYQVEALQPRAMSEILGEMADWPDVDRASVVAAIHLYRGSRAGAVLALRSHSEHAPRDAELRALLERYRGD